MSDPARTVDATPKPAGGRLLKLCLPLLILMESPGHAPAWAAGQVPPPVPPPSSGWIVGHVFEDVNDNGVQDDCEEGLAGVVAMIVDSTLEGLAVMTDSEGAFMVSVAAGEVLVDLDDETLPPNSQMTVGTDPTTVFVPHGGTVPLEWGFQQQADPCTVSARLFGIAFTPGRQCSKISSASHGAAWTRNGIHIHRPNGTCLAGTHGTVTLACDDGSTEALNVDCGHETFFQTLATALDPLTATLDSNAIACSPPALSLPGNFGFYPSQPCAAPFAPSGPCQLAFWPQSSKPMAARCTMPVCPAGATSPEECETHDIGIDIECEPACIFADGFESADTSAWSSSTP